MANAVFFGGGEAPSFPKLLSTKDVCAALGIDAKTLRWHVKEGHLPYIVFGSGEERPRRRYHPDDVAAFIRSRTVRGEPTIGRASRRRRLAHCDQTPEAAAIMQRLIRLSEERAQRTARVNRPTRGRP